MLYDFFDFIKNYPIFCVLCIILFLSPIPLSMAEWNTHHKKIICYAADNTCKMEVYSYKHDICWDWLFSRRHSYKGCSLPKYKSSEIDLISLYDIKDVIVNKEDRFYKVYLVGKDGNKSYLSQFKEEERARYLSSKLKIRIKKWQEPASVLNNEMENSYFYEFVE